MHRKVCSERKSEDAVNDAQKYTEQDIRNYIFKHSLYKPKTNYLTVALIILLHIVISFLLAFIIDTVTYALPPVLIYIACFFFVFFLFSNLLCIKLVECYQHYASIDIRRACLCMPTCSEYAISVLKKHFFPIALYKIHKRLTKTCIGKDYKIDFP